MATTLVKFDVSGVKGLAAKLGELSGEAMQQAVANALNHVIDAGFDIGRAGMNAGINLTDQYIKDKMSIGHASPGNPRASILTVGDLTGLSHYDPVQLAPIAGERGRGVQVTVHRGSAKPVKAKNVFVMPGKTDSEGNPMIFRRLAGTTSTGKGRLQRVLGPSPYQLFSAQFETLVPELEDMLGEQLLDSVEQEILKAIP